MDRYWGIGVSKEEFNRRRLTRWPGQNKMGELLSEVRDEICSEIDKKLEKANRSAKKAQNEDAAAVPLLVDPGYSNSDDDKNGEHGSKGGTVKGSTRKVVVK